MCSYYRRYEFSLTGISKHAFRINILLHIIKVENVLTTDNSLEMIHMLPVVNMKLEMLGMTDQHTMSVIVVCGLKLETIAKGFSST